MSSHDTQRFRTPPSSDAHDIDPVRSGETFTSAHEEFAELRRDWMLDPAGGWNA